MLSRTCACLSRASAQGEPNAPQSRVKGERADDDTPVTLPHDAESKELLRIAAWGASDRSAGSGIQ